MSFSHLTLATRHVERTTAFFQTSFGFARNRVPDNVPMDSLWLDIGRGQEMHVVYVDGFEAGPFEGEFGRHVALYHPLSEFAALKQRLLDQGAELLEPLRSTPFERFFFREPVNGYVFEVIDDRRAKRESA
jgi:catechol 2,3-dioxygenase-like lactoylglutathione lyase family enzyme